MNDNFETIEFASVYGKRQPVTSGLTWGYYGGRWGGFSITEGTLSLTNNEDNYISVERATGVIGVEIGVGSPATPTNWSNTTLYARVYKVTTGGGIVSSADDYRAGPNGVMTAPTTGTIGTVTHTSGALTLNSVMLGAGTDDSKVVAGITSDGVSKLILGVAGSSVGSLDFKNGTSGTINLAPVTGALGSRAILLPAASGTIALTSDIGTAGALAVDTDGTLAANSDTRIASQKATKTYVDQIVAANDAMVFKGSTDCSANPNYPAADRGHTYRVSVAGKIGGASGVNVEAGDLFICLTDSTASGTQAAVGANWTIAQANLDGAVIGPASVTDSHFTQFDGITGKLIKGGIALDTDGTLAGNSDTRLASQKAVKTYADSLAASLGTVTHTGGALTANAVVLGAGTNDEKVVAGIISDGTSKFTLGVAGASVGGINFKNATSGTVTLQPVTGALGAVTLLMPAASGTLALTSDIGTAGALASDIDGTLAANSDTRIATQKATKTYVDQIVAANDAMVFKGSTDCSANPNYPAANRGDTYRVSVAGKIGGASGINVEAGDLFICLTDSTASGNQATVGTSWTIAQANLDGAVIGPASVTDSNVVLFDGTTGKLIKQSTLTALIDTISSTRGSILYRGAAGWAALGPGTSGQELKTNGAGADPAWVTEPYDVGGACSGVPSVSLVIMRFPAPRAIAFAVSLTNSQGVAAIAATAQTDFDILKNGVSFGTMRFAAAGTVATFISAGGATFAAGDVLTVVAPASPDATLSDIGFTLVGTR